MNIRSRASRGLKPKGLEAAFRPRPQAATKRTVGTVAVLGGSAAYPHAPVMAALGARSAGAGLVELEVPSASRPAAAFWVPEATFGGGATVAAWARHDVLVAGMGLGRSRSAAVMVGRLVRFRGRLVMDADALNGLAAMKAAVRPTVSGWIMTPHEGEAARLLGVAREEVAARRRAAAEELRRRYGATVVLKGERTLVLSADGKRMYENRTGNPFMALGGMGDLLAGVIGARWAYLRDDAFLAAAGGVYLHSLAADRVVAEHGDMSLGEVARMIGSLRLRLDT